MLFGSGQLRYRIGLACSGRDDISARSERVSAFQNLSVNRWLWGAVTNVRTAAGGAGPRRSAKRGFRHQAGDARSVGRVPRHGQFGAMGRGSEEMVLARADLQLTTPLQKTHARAAIAAIAIWLRRICISRRASNGLARRSSRIILIPQRFGAGTRIGGTVGGIFGWLGVSGEKSSHRIKLLTSARGSLLRYHFRLTPPLLQHPLPFLSPAAWRGGARPRGVPPGAQAGRDAGGASWGVRPPSRAGWAVLPRPAGPRE